MSISFILITFLRLDISLILTALLDLDFLCRAVAARSFDLHFSPTESLGAFRFLWTAFGWRDVERELMLPSSKCLATKFQDWSQMIFVSSYVRSKGTDVRRPLDETTLDGSR
jgi:hypothetical protein